MTKEPLTVYNIEQALGLAADSYGIGTLGCYHRPCDYMSPIPRHDTTVPDVAVDVFTLREVLLAARDMVSELHRENKSLKFAVLQAHETLRIVGNAIGTHIEMEKDTLQQRVRHKVVDDLNDHITTLHNKEKDKYHATNCRHPRP